MELGKVMVIIMLVFLFTGLGLLVYGISDNGRLVRDYGFYSSGISDDSVKGIWCYMNGLPEDYHKEEDQEFCGGVKVKMKCKFTNKGDMCVIEKETEQ